MKCVDKSKLCWIWILDFHFPWRAAGGVTVCRISLWVYGPAHWSMGQRSNYKLFYWPLAIWQLASALSIKKDMTLASESQFAVFFSKKASTNPTKLPAHAIWNPFPANLNPLVRPRSSGTGGHPRPEALSASGNMGIPCAFIVSCQVSGRCLRRDHMKLFVNRHGQFVEAYWL